MRIAALVTVLLLVTGCSHQVSGQSGPTQSSSPASPAPTSGKPAAPSTPPAAGAAISDVVAWIEAGHPADPARYHAVTRDGVTTQLGSDIAFTVPAAKVACTTDSDAHRRRAGLSGRSGQAAAPARHGLRRVERRLGRLRRHEPADRGGARRSGSVRQRRWARIGERRHVVLRRLPLPRRPSWAVLRELRTPVGSAVQ